MTNPEEDESEIESITESEEEPFSDTEFVKIGMLPLPRDFSTFRFAKLFYLYNFKHA
jgi:hypothetical protein